MNESIIYEISVKSFTKGLNNLVKILDKAAAHAESKKFSIDVLLNARLYPDQFHLIKQIQIACDTAKLGVARITGKDAPVHEDKETTLEELKSRLSSVIQYLETYKPEDFKDSSDRKVTQPRWEGKYLTGFEYLTQHALPNFYFHVTTAYAIFRHNGVDLGKRDYLGEMPYKT
ncbi:hypothetical protein LPTSP3_g23340 [Leptospira kobayashii]|uniref:PF09351 domain protein n=1 Tax=Leptospira kobayashii TaxID=1917830 RepID=A0ABN6KG20_9LEPT|nr:DUF1993 domain-containing protein [Leptospira kobayashii]BDA79404.1 hypothetical protein LPTSP3_g23340 [Leptospira kobayashii]